MTNEEQHAQGQAAHTARQHRVRHLLVLLLALNSGATDAIGFVGLGGVFTSVMTGNMVLLGVSVAQRDLTLGVASLAAIACFAFGAGLGARIAQVPKQGDPVWPKAVTRALGVELAAFSVFLAGWWITGGDPGGALQVGLLTVNAVALGIQSSAIQRFGVSGLSTTYLTGTLTTVVIHLMTGKGLGHVRNSIEILVALVVGAMVGAWVTVHVWPAAPLLQVGLVGLALAVALRAFRERPSDPIAPLAPGTGQ